MGSEHNNYVCNLKVIQEGLENRSQEYETIKMQKYIYLKIKQVLETKNKMDPVNRVDTSLSILISVILLRINFTSKIVGKLEDSPKLTANGVKKEKI